MSATSAVRKAAGYAAGGAALAALGYAAWAAVAWTRYGHPAKAGAPEEEDPRLDHLFPVYDVVERHHVRVSAPADVTLAAACELNLLDSGIARAIFKGREIMMRATPAAPLPANGLRRAALSLGWGILAEEPGHQIVFGAVTRPWEANPTFRALLPSEFVGFRQPGFVKIAWTLRADPIGDDASIFRTETRAIGTDAEARDAFRRYWALVSPGVALIRRAMLMPIKRAAEARVARNGQIVEATEYDDRPELTVG